MADPGIVQDAADVLIRGGVVVLPTDTVYGIAARAEDAKAVDRLFAIKGRPHDKAVALLVSGEEMASRWADLTPARAEIASGWPGALTVVVPRTIDRHGVFLGGDPSTVGLRMPNHAFLLDLIERVGPLAATSANPTGDATPQDLASIATALKDVDLFVDGGLLGGVPSRVVSFIAERKELR